MALPVFQTFPLTTAAGAEIQGLDLSVPLSDDTTKRLRSIWLRHGVLFFRN
ncbi:MAG: TauD/TfdA family dioxygenase, partial [SAR324 cluster bacterium]|nr:TauD/TfdA family dioxygenase [SAR324 cluster bacterium]